MLLTIMSDLSTGTGWRSLFVVVGNREPRGLIRAGRTTSPARESSGKNSKP
ncbi:MAG: hypothetical protein IPP91_17985 [Betaproteobacteria bacterium]|nr:hypothetical protein [Betaproteobacteria bacterium]